MCDDATRVIMNELLLTCKFFFIFRDLMSTFAEELL